MRESERQLLELEIGTKKAKAAYMLVEMDMRDDANYEGPTSLAEIAEALGIHPKTLWEWRTKDRNFIRYKNSIANDFLSESRTLVFKQLRKLISASQPSVKAIDIFARLEGLYDNKLTIRNEEIGDGKESNDDVENSLAKLKAMKNLKESQEEN